jgi:hypothetical protein
MPSPDTWARRLAEWRASGLTLTQYCVGRDFTPGAIRYWAKRLPTDDSLSVEPPPVPPPAAFARVLREPMPVHEESPVVIEVSAVRLVLRRGFDPVTLRAVLDLVTGVR